MAANAFGTPFSSGKSSGAGYGTSIQSDSRGTSTKAPSAFGNGGSMSVTSKGWTSDEEEEEDDGGGFLTNVEERLLKDQQKEADKAAKEEADRLKAEEEARKAEEERLRQEAAAKAAAEKAAREKAAKVASDRAKGEKTTGVLEEDAPPSPSVEPSTRSVSPAAAAVAPVSTNTPEQLRARQDIARKLRSALGAEDESDNKDEIIAGLKAEAKSAGVADTAFDSFMERELARPTQGQLTARQDAANRLKAGIRSGDFNVISAAKEDAINAGVGYDLDRFIARQEEELARRGEITNRVGLEGRGSGLDEYYQTQTEKSRGVPLGFSSGKGRPIAPAHRIHTRLNRLVNRKTYEGDQDRSISPVAAAMRYEEALARQLAVDSPLDYIKMQRDRAEKRRIALEGGASDGTNLYGFGR